MSPTMQDLWERLTPEHQTLLTQLMESLAALDSLSRPAGTPDRLSKLFAAWEAEDATLTPEEIAAAEAEWRDIQAALNRNRAPEPPLFP
jgi:hypothetical protein